MIGKLQTSKIMCVFGDRNRILRPGGKCALIIYLRLCVCLYLQYNAFWRLITIWINLDDLAKLKRDVRDSYVGIAHSSRRAHYLNDKFTMDFFFSGVFWMK